MKNTKHDQVFIIGIIVLIVTSFILTNKFLGSSPEMTFVMNGSTLVIEKSEKLFTYSDMLLSTFSSLVMGMTIMYLLTGRWREYSDSSAVEEKEEDKREKWNMILDTLKEDEQNIYKEILDAGGEMFQKDLVSLSGFNGAKVTRILDRLEKRKCVERKSHGMTNKVMLK